MTASAAAGDALELVGVLSVAAPSAPGTSTAAAAAAAAAAASPAVEVGALAGALYRLRSDRAKGSVLVLLCQQFVPAVQVYSWTEALFAHVQPKR